MGQLSFTPEMLIGKVKEVSSSCKDYRQGKNISYSVEDVFLSALSVFFMQCASFLAYQEAMEKKYGMNNARNLFGIKKIPTPEQIRNVLDNYSPQVIFPVFSWCFQKLLEFNYLADFQTELGYLVALDGTGYFSSDAINCSSCLKKTSKTRQTGRESDKEQVTYYHSVLTPVLVKPGKEAVIPLTPEFITPQDGDDKQDCENKAAKRWLKESTNTYLTLLAQRGDQVTILGDDLYSRQPVMDQILFQHLHYILVAKQESHPWLFDWFNNLEAGEDQDQKQLVTETVAHTNWRSGTFHYIYTYTFANHLPLKDSADALLVNLVEVKVVKLEDGSLIYHNSFISDHEINKENVADIVTSGRARWKVENEGNNTLKTKGYHFEHSFGHGGKHLATLLLSLILLAFLFHTLLDLTNQSYQQIRALIGSRVRFFNDLKTLTIYSCYKNFVHLFRWMHEALTQGKHLPNFSLPPPLMFTLS